MKHFKVRKLVLLALVLIGVGTVGTWLTRESATDSHDPVEVTVPVAGMDSLRINASNRRIDFAVSNNDEVRVVMEGNTGRTDLTAEVVGNGIVIEAKEEQHRQFMNFNFGFSFQFNRPRSSTLTVYLPEHEFEQITATTTNAHISAGNLPSTDVVLTTSNGRVDASNMPGDLMVRTTNGQVDLRDIAGNVRVNSTNGSVNLNRIDGNVSVETTNGRLEFTNPTLAQDVSLRTTNGRITVRLDEEPEDVRFTTDTTNGDVTLFGGNSWNHGNAYYEVNLRTTNGRITVETR